MSTDAIALCAAAIVKLGAMPIASFEDATPEADAAARLYPIVRDSMLASHPWSFALEQRELTLDSTPPVADFSAAFILPEDCLRTLSAGYPASGRGVVYRIFGDRLHADADRIVLSYLRRPPEAVFPSFFCSALIARLAAELCLPITESSSRAELLYRLASAELQLARLQDSQQSTPQRIEDDLLIQARLS